MKLDRRTLLVLLGAASVPSVSRDAKAQAYPTRPVRIIVGFPAGGGQDIVARLVGGWLSEHLGQPFIVENRPGAASNVAAEAVVRSPADGYTLFVVGVNNAINATLYDKLTFDLVRDIAPVGGISQVPNVMEVNPAVPAKTVPEFIAYAKANPGKLNMASGGNGTSMHLCGELFKRMTGIDMVHVPYRGAGPALTGLIGGQVQVMFDNLPSSIEHIRAGKLRALAVTTMSRSEALPDTPALSDFLPGFEASGWAGFGAPKNTPIEIIDKLNQELNAALADAMMKARLADLGGIILSGGPAEFGRFVAAETEKWGRLIRAVNIRPE